jgi:hypothetical protein
VLFNYGVDTGTVWKSAPFHEPILWRHVSWDRHSQIRHTIRLKGWCVAELAAASGRARIMVFMLQRVTGGPDT